jgi:hypothetical protein
MFSARWCCNIHALRKNWAKRWLGCFPIAVIEAVVSPALGGVIHRAGSGAGAPGSSAGVLLAAVSQHCLWNGTPAEP